MASIAFPTRLARLGGRALGGLALGLTGALVGGLLGGLVSGLTIGLAGGQAFAGAIGLARSQAIGLGFGITIGLAFGVAAGLTTGLTIGLRLGLRSGLPVHADLRLAGRGIEFIKKLWSGLVIGLVIGVVFGLFAGLPYVFVYALAYGLVLGLQRFFGSSVRAESASSPTLSYRGDFTHSVIEVVALGLMLGLVAGLTLGPTLGLAYGLTLAVTIGLGGGLALGLYRRSWLDFSIATTRCRLSRSQRLPAPWRAMSTFEDCHRLGLLRTIGPVYQFRHAQLQDHLAPPLASHPESASAVAGPAGP